MTMVLGPVLKKSQAAKKPASKPVTPPAKATPVVEEVEPVVLETEEVSQ